MDVCLWILNMLDNVFIDLMSKLTAYSLKNIFYFS